MIHCQCNLRASYVLALAASLGLWLPAGSGVSALAQTPNTHAAQAKAGATPPRNLTIDDFFALKEVSDPQLSPEGNWVAYVVRTANLKEDKNERQIWMVATSGGEAIPLTAQSSNSSRPRWSPDGKYLAFLSARGENAKTQVWTLDRRGGEAQQLTETIQGVNSFEWSPSGEKLVLVLQDPSPEDLAAATKLKEGEKPSPPKPRPWVIDRQQFKRDTVGYLERRRTHLYVFELASHKMTQVSSGDYDDSEPAWSPDGRFLAFTSNRTENPDGNFNTDIWVVASDNPDKGQSLVHVTTNPGADHSPAWSPNGKWIATVSQIDAKAIDYATPHLAVSPAMGGEQKVLTLALDRTVSSPHFSSDGQYIYFALEDDGTEQIARILAGGGEVTRVIGGRRKAGTYSLGKDGTIAALISEPKFPEEVFLSTGNELRQLTHTNDAVLPQIRLGEVEYFKTKSKDGTEVASYLFKPPAYNPELHYPLILRPHGGPVSQYDAGFNFTAQLFAANGYVVVTPNPRGSSGYGQKYCEAIFADWGNKDFQDDMAATDYAISKGLADPAKMGVGGWSYGGISTNFIITQTDRFKAAISGASEFLYVTNYGHDHYQKLWELELGLPWKNRALWERISPFNLVEKIVTPTLVMGGNIDWNVPIINSEQLYQSLKRLGRTTELVVYPGEYHSFTRPTFIKDRFERYLAWYAKYVKGEAPPPQKPAD
jgi:dipeptidyl aminopeptidase/acylaminoacyl peptidase